jgi:hypothetical protein
MSKKLLVLLILALTMATIGGSVQLVGACPNKELTENPC